MHILENKRVWNQVLKGLKLDKRDRMILGHVAFGCDDEETSIRIGTTEEIVTARRKEIMAQLGDLGIAANENMLGLSLFMTMTEGLNANFYNSKGEEDPNRPDIKTRINTAKIFNLMTGGMLGRALLKFTERMFDRDANQETVAPPDWVNQIDQPLEVVGQNTQICQEEDKEGE